MKLNWYALSGADKYSTGQRVVREILKAAHERWRFSYQAATMKYEFSKNDFEASKEAYAEWVAAGRPDPDDPTEWSEFINNFMPLRNVEVEQSVIRGVDDLLRFGTPTYESFVESLLIERAQTAVMYHGTSIKNLRSILAKGLIPHGVPKAWEKDDSVSLMRPSRAAFGGIYLTTNIMTAKQATHQAGRAEGNEAVIIVCQIQPRSLFADEDDIVLVLNNLDNENQQANESTAYSLYLSRLGYGDPDARVYYDDYKKSWVKKRSRQLFYNLRVEPHPKLKQRVEDILDKDAFDAVVDRWAAFAQDDWALSSMASRYDVDKSEIELPGKSEAERDFRKVGDQLTRTMKHIARPDMSGSNFSLTGRLMTPIKFSGRNKIIGAFRFFDGPDYKTFIEVVYGSIPEETKKEWSQRVGEWIEASEMEVVSGSV